MGPQTGGKYGKFELCGAAAAAMQGTMKPEHITHQLFNNISHSLRDWGSDS